MPPKNLNNTTKLPETSLPP
jgi:hypothetical protein